MTKWEDVAHLYSPYSGIPESTFISGRWKLPEGLPILRHLDDMDTHTAKVFANAQDSRYKPSECDFVTFHKDNPYHDRWNYLRPFFRIQQGESTIVHAKDLFTPIGFLWATSQGFDLFGLIESGQAVRKESTR